MRHLADIGPVSSTYLVSIASAEPRTVIGARLCADSAPHGTADRESNIAPDHDADGKSNIASNRLADKHADDPVPDIFSDARPDVATDGLAHDIGAGRRERVALVLGSRVLRLHGRSSA